MRQPENHVCKHRERVAIAESACMLLTSNDFGRPKSGRVDELPFATEHMEVVCIDEPNARMANALGYQGVVG